MTESPDLRNERDLFLIRESVEDRRKRVEHLKGIVEGGAYYVPVGKVADAVVAFYRRPKGWPAAGNAAAGSDSC